MRTIFPIILAVFLLGCQPPAGDQSGESPANALISDAQAATVGAASATSIASKFVDDNLCADCHQEIFDSYQHVAMAKSFYDFEPATAVESFEDNHFFHALSDNHYEMDLIDGKLRMTRWRQRDDGTRIHQFSQTADYVVGSGSHVRTYLSRNAAGEMYQLPVVWYAQESRWGIAPGYDRTDHLDFDRPITRQCMFCHNAFPEIDEGADRFGTPHIFPQKMPQGIGCQRCHGPGAEHIRISSELDSQSADDLRKIRGSIVNSANLSPQLQDDVCNQCHFQSMSQRTSFVRRFGQRDYGYRPGKSLTEYMVHFEPDRNNDLADHFEINHHPYRLRQSKCFTQTEGGFRCTLCHDPHVKTPDAERARHYRGKCLSCHGSDDCLDQDRGRQPDANCVACHMPERRTTDVVHVTMTDHRIMRRSRLTDPVAALDEIDVPIDMPIRRVPFGSRKLSDDQARQYELFARAIDDDQSALQPLAEFVQQSDEVPVELSVQLAQMQLQNRQYELAGKTLAAMPSEFHQLPLFQTNLAVSLIGRHNHQAAIKQLEETTSAHPTYSPAWYNLGVALQREGLDQRAVESLEAAIALRPGYAKAMNRLGSLHASNNRLEAAQRQFERATEANANDVDSIRKLSAVLRRRKMWPEAIGRIQDALRLSGSEVRLLKEQVLLLVDVENTTARNPANALAAANRLVRLEQGMEPVILKTMAMMESEDIDEALVYISEHLLDNQRKVEAGMLIAACQMKMGSKAAARQNFEGAKAALNHIQSDRITRIATAYATQYFVQSATEPAIENRR